MADTSLRYIEMLRMLPGHTPGIAVSELRSKLEAAGYPVTRRSIERDLVKLSTSFPILLNDKGRPAGWSWASGEGFSAPGMDAAEAMELELAARYLKPLLPVTVWQSLAPRLGEARATLRLLGKGPLARWKSRVAFVDDGQPLQAPQVSPDVVAVVHDSLLHQRRMSVEYRSMFAEAPRRYELNPVALVHVGSVGYLIATLWDYADVRHLALHRMSNAKALKTKASEPEGFDLQRYLKEEAAFDIPGERELKLKLRVSEWMARHLEERPLAADQKINQDGQDDASWIVQAIVRESERLIWWLRSHGEAVEVVQPAVLRKRLAAEFKRLAETYAGRT
jgi:predicted DNA-binding transcriptional regulator YafY